MSVRFLFASCLFFSIVLIAKGNASNNFLMITDRKKGDKKSEEKVDKLEHKVLGVLSKSEKSEGGEDNVKKPPLTLSTLELCYLFSSVIIVIVLMASGSNQTSSSGISSVATTGNASKRFMLLTARKISVIWVLMILMAGLEFGRWIRWR
ncbi:hypothetical protein QL285_085869 [Trifolium repens]|nr:hypothetical protein QL285_085869 [Trifolium repens]